MDGFQKRRMTMRHFLRGADYWKALEAMDLASKHHVGLRKDGVTPEFDHQLCIAHYLSSLRKVLVHPEETLCVAFLHDVREDYGVADEEIRGPFGPVVADGVARMTKTFRGVKADPAVLFDEMSRCPVASIAKAADRIHNFQSMVGVFTPDKQRAYIAECREFFLPMISKARERFRKQDDAYVNAKHLLKSQMALIQASLDAAPQAA